MIIPAQVLLLLFGKVLLFSSSPVLSAKARNAKCSPFPYAFLEHGRITSTGMHKYIFHCNPGYFLASQRKVRCWKGKWSSDQQPKCMKAEGFCDDPPSVPGGEIHGEERHIGSVIQYMCKPGFLLMGEGKRSCLRSGHWSGITPSCMDESEPLQKVAERLKDKFVTNIGSYSSDSVFADARLLDRDSIQHGLELVILLDRSSSIDPEDFKSGIDFIKFLFRTFGVRNGNNTTGTRAAVITFGTNADILFNLDNATITGPLAADKALDTLQAGGGGTAMEEAFMSVYTRLPPLRTEAKKALFLITDGEPNIGSKENTVIFATQLRRTEDFEIFTLGVGKDINKQFLRALASEPAINHVFTLDKYSDFRRIMETIKDKPTRARPVSLARCGYVKHPEHFLKRWPWLAAIYVGFPDAANETRLSFCSGTLICNQWVITAASCFFHVHETNTSEKVAINSTKEVFVTLGERDVINDDANQLNFYASDVVIHPNFDPLNDLQNNLALLKLNNPAPMGRFRPACLPPTNKTILLHMDLKTNASIAGWGLQPTTTNDRGINGATVRFHASNVTVILEEESLCVPKSGETANENIFCAGFWAQTCVGDLGSPIIAVDPVTNLHHLIGVLSRRSMCHKGINMYSEMTKYIQWINDVTNQCQLKHFMVR